MRRKVELQIITETIERLIPGAVPAFLSVKVTETLPGTAGHDGDPHRHTWSGTPAGLAERVLTALYGRPGATPQTSPLVQADDAKRARNVGGEIVALMAADHELTSAPWYPVRPGDVVHVHYEDTPTLAAFGETYIIGDVGGGLMNMELLSHTCRLDEPDSMTGHLSAQAADDPIYELWFEAGPHLLTIVRDGQVVHNGGAR